MPRPIQRGRTPPRVRRRDRRALRPEAAPGERSALPANWRARFFETLAETSNVARACASVGVSASTIYDLKRRDLGFARRWLAALAEGYDKLEMELLDRLRNGEAPDGPRYNYAVAVRALQAHRETVDKERGRRASVDAAAVRASIMRKVAEMRALVVDSEGSDGAAPQEAAR